MKKIIVLLIVLTSCVSYSQTTKSEKEVKVEEVPYRNVNLINPDGTINSLNDSPQLPESPDNDNSIYNTKSLEIYPEFPGGKENLDMFLSKNILLTNEMKKNKVKGEVLAFFTVEKNGSISDLKIVRGKVLGVENEVLRVLKSMPKWKPGMLNGKIVRSSFSLPIIIDATKQ